MFELYRLSLLQGVLCLELGPTQGDKVKNDLYNNSYWEFCKFALDTDGLQRCALFRAAHRVACTKDAAATETTTAGLSA